MSSTENNTNVLQSSSSKLQMRMNYLWEVTHQLRFTSQNENVAGQSAPRDPESKREELAQCQKYLEADGDGGGAQLWGLYKSWDAGGSQCWFHASGGNCNCVISASALFFLRVGQEVLVRQDSKYSWLPSHILLLPDLLLPGSFNQKFISECTWVAS